MQYPPEPPRAFYQLGDSFATLEITDQFSCLVTLPCAGQIIVIYTQVKIQGAQFAIVKTLFEYLAQPDQIIPPA